MIEILSLGAGVQSTTVALMSVRGELPKLDHAIFSDTGWEPAAVYKHFEWLRPILESAGIAVHDDLVHAEMRGRRWVSMPLYVRGADGKVGMVRRQCTREYKIDPIEKKIREILGIAPRKHGPKEIVSREWFGISFDEVARMRTSHRRYTKSWYPLVEAFQPPKSRWDCYRWIESHGYPEPPRSACIGCPFHSNEEWRALTADEFEDACTVDETLRDQCSKPGKKKYNKAVYLHRSGVPLREADLGSDGGPDMFGNDCSGMCGV